MIGFTLWLGMWALAMSFPFIAVIWIFFFSKKPNKRSDCWEEKLEAARPLLTGDSVDTVLGKRAFLNEVLRENLPDFLEFPWVDLRITQEEIRERYQSACESMEFDLILSAIRLIGPDRIITELSIKGQYFPLYRVGAEGRIIDFEDLYEPQCKPQ